jgi:hypothetical protein
LVKEEYDFLKEQAIRHSEGDIIVAGSQFGYDVRALKEACPERNIIVIDSFKGLAAPKKQDLGEWPMVEGECAIKGGKDTYLKTFIDAKVIPPKEIYEIWISKKKLKDIPKRKIGMMFLDLDHYQPTKDCLEFFYPWMSENGIIIVHDYEYIRCPGIKKACEEFSPNWESVKNMCFGILYT